MEDFLVIVKIGISPSDNSVTFIYKKKIPNYFKRNF